MKKLFFTVAFMLVSVFTFANQLDVTTEKIEIKIENNYQSEKMSTLITFSSLSDFESFDVSQLGINSESTVFVTVSIGSLSVTLTENNIAEGEEATIINTQVINARNILLKTEK